MDFMLKILQNTYMKMLENAKQPGLRTHVKKKIQLEFQTYLLIQQQDRNTFLVE
jgi:hypothetical protein